MFGTTSCPDEQVLGRLVLGRLAEEEAEALARHLEQCGRCAATVHSLAAEDTLVAAARARPGAGDEPDDEIVEALIERLSGLAAAVTDPKHENRADTPFGPDLTALLTPPQEPGELGRLGPYRVLRVLGAGGMGVVYQAEDRALKRLVALKTLKPGLAASPAARQRFLREAQAAAAVTHDHVVTIHQVGDHRGVPFLAMPLLEGETLEQRLGRAEAGEGLLDPAEVLRVGREIAQGLEAAHARGLVHRDIKPANVWLEKDTGRVKILDFGLARALDEETFLGEPGVVAGTPAYLAPEVRTGLAVDGRCDLFSLGCVLSRMLTGATPGQAPAPAFPPSPRGRNPEAPAELAGLVRRLLARDPADRPRSARQVVDALQGIERRRREPQGSSRPRRKRRRRVVAALLLAGALAAAAVLQGTTDKETVTVSLPKKVPDKPRDDLEEWARRVAGLPAEQQVEAVRARFKEVNPDSTETVGFRIQRGVVMEANCRTDHVKDLSPLRALPGLRLLTCRFSTPGRGNGILKDLSPLRGLRLTYLDCSGNSIEDLSPLEGMPLEQLVCLCNPIRDLSPLAGMPLQSLDLAWTFVSDLSPLRGLPLTRLDARTDLAPGLSPLLGSSLVELRCVFDPERDAEVVRAMTRLVKINDRPADEFHKAADAELRAGAPLGPAALVARPAGLEGTRGWTLETRGPRGGLAGLAASPDGRWLATAGDDGTVRLWEPDSGRLARALVGHESGVRALAWSPDGKTLASAGGDRTVRLWDAGSGRPLRTLPGHTDSVLALAWAPGGKALASGGADETVRLWDPESGRARGALRGKAGPVLSVAWAPDGKALACGCEGRVVQLWQPEGERLLRTLEGHTGRVAAVAFRPGGRTLASAGGDGTVRFWDPESGRAVRSPEDQGEGVASLAWAPDGKLLASAAGTAVRLWGPDSGQGQRTHDVRFSLVKAVAWAADGKSLFAGDGGGSVHCWAEPSGERLRTLPGHHERFTAPMAWSADGKALATGSADGRIRLWDLSAGELRRTLQTEGWVLALAWSPDGKTLASSRTDSTVLLWDVSSAEVRHTLRGHTRHAYDLAWSPDGKTLASAGEDATVRLWEAGTGTQLHALTAHTSQVNALAWSPDGTRLASASWDGTARLWDAASGKALAPPLKHPQAVHAAAWSPDGRTVATGSIDFLVRLWDAATGEQRAALDGHTRAVWSLAWSPDGKAVISSGDDQALRFWDGSRGKPLRTLLLSGPRAEGGSLLGRLGRLSPDGLLFAAGEAGTVRLLRAGTGQACQTLVVLRDDAYLVLEPFGHYGGSAPAEAELTYVVQTDKGQELLAPAEFAQKFGWKNDRDRIGVRGR
jgi:WD40 repeat protein/serine/threonine protein kinase